MFKAIIRKLLRMIGFELENNAEKKLFPDLASWASKYNKENRISFKNRSENEFMYIAANDNKLIPAGYTYLGQFIAHELTFRITQKSERKKSENIRTPIFDLDSVYGHGPFGDYYLYNQRECCNYGKTHFLINKNKIDQSGKTIYDLPRKAHSKSLFVPLIADSRNDENFVISQLHTAFLLFHNKIMDVELQKINSKDKSLGTKKEQCGHRRHGTPFRHEKIEREKKIANELDIEAIFQKVRRIVQWHFQWIIVFDYLPRIVGKKLVLEILGYKDGKRPKSFPNWNFKCITKKQKPFIPKEFSVAAFRFGHSMVKQQYKFISDPPKQAMIFDAKRPFKPPREDLSYLDWELFFFENGRTGNLSRRIDVFLDDPMKKVPETMGDKNIVIRNLKRSIIEKIPSGQSVAKKLKSKGIDTEILNACSLKKYDKRNIYQNDLGELYTSETDEPDKEATTFYAFLEEKYCSLLSYINHNGEEKIISFEEFCNHSPLWFYILLEATICEEGLKLGSVGGRIVAEVILNVLRGDKHSFLNECPTWTPKYYESLDLKIENGDNSMIEFLKYVELYSVA